jgi:hypothetical protein
MTRPPCLWALSYSAPSIVTESVKLDKPPSSPIHVDEKSKCCHRIKNVFINDRGFPDQSYKVNVLLHNINGGPDLWKLKHPPPPLGVVDPLFSLQYDESIHGAHLCKDLDLSHLDTALQQTIYGIFVPVKNYKCVIDTGNAHPIALKKIMYSPNELPIMHKAVAAFKKIGHIRQIHDGRWVFKAVLAPKPHQEHARHINKFVWRFCVKYVPLNSVTCIIAYPIPCCDSDVSEEFGTGEWIWC